jgi:hypothetical protein
MEGMVLPALLGAVSALLVKIVWDWLKQKGESKGTCARLEALEQAFHLNQVAMATDLATIKTDISYIKRKLDMNGSAR